MSNSWFKFKQFTIQQDRCGMKVSTDACIQGAWVPIHEDVKHVLDIGTGTGLLSLMLAQRNSNMLIDAIEIDEAAAQQAKENVASSPWAERINVLQGDAKNYPFECKYDLIICNPPFFQNSLQSAEEKRNIARHNAQLAHEDIVALFDKLLSINGYGATLFSAPEQSKFEELLKINGFDIFNKLFIIPKTGKSYNRVVSLCSKDKNRGYMDKDLAIKSSNDAYTGEFTQLLAPFYLQL